MVAGLIVSLLVLTVLTWESRDRLVRGLLRVEGRRLPAGMVWRIASPACETQDQRGLRISTRTCMGRTKRAPSGP